MYDVLIIGAGPGGIFSAYELMERKPDLKIAVFEVGHPLENTTLPMISAALSMSISEKRQPLN